MVKNLPASAGDMRDVCSISGSGQSPGGGHGSPLQCSCLDRPVDRGAWLGWGVSVPSTVWFKRCAKTVVLNHEDTSDVGYDNAAFSTYPFDLLMGHRSDAIRQICKPKKELKIEVWKGGNIPYYLQVEKMEKLCRVNKTKTWS